MRRELEIGLSINPTAASAAAAAKSLASHLDDGPAVPVRLIGVRRNDTRVQITLAVTLGSIDEIKSADPAARTAVSLISRLIDALSAYDPAFAVLPQMTALEACAAARSIGQHGPPSDALLSAVRQLVATG
jgi:hypothetical protein